MTEKARENRLRRLASKDGLRLVKSRKRDVYHPSYGGYMLVDVSSNFAVFGHDNGGNLVADLDDIEGYLTGEE